VNFVRLTLFFYKPVLLLEMDKVELRGYLKSLIHPCISPPQFWEEITENQGHFPPEESPVGL
jgi:hypothetical protein